MKRFLFFILLASCFIACSDDNETTVGLDPDKLLGTWVLNGVNGELAETNDWFVCEYTSEGQNFSGRVYLDDGSYDWYYKSLSSYYVEDDFIYVSSEYDNLKLQATIVDGDPDLILWTEIENVEYGDDLNQNRTFSGYRSTVDYSDDIVNGYWEGGNVIDGREPTVYMRFKYKDDSTFVFQTRDNEDDPWSEKVDNDGYYYLLGDLFAMTWFNDLNTGIEEYTNEAWVISIDCDSMVWSAIRDDGVEERYELTRVAE